MDVIYLVLLFYLELIIDYLSVYVILLSMNTSTLNSDLTGVLRGIGFSDNEGLVYLACLELGEASIWDIAKKSGVKRTSCYVLLDELALKGYASHATDGRRTLYSVVGPRQLFRAVERRHERFASSLSQLEALASRALSKPQVRLFEGLAGIQEAYAMTLEGPKGGEILIYGTEEVEGRYPEFIGEYLAARVKKGISVRAILPDTPKNRSLLERDAGELRRTRFLPPEEYGQRTEVNVLGDAVLYIAHSEKEPFATVFGSPALARDERQRFEVIWKAARA